MLQLSLFLYGKMEMTYIMNKRVIVMILFIIPLLFACTLENQNDQTNEQKNDPKDLIQNAEQNKDGQKKETNTQDKNKDNESTNPTEKNDAESNKIPLEKKFFNEIQVVNQQNIIQNPDNLLVLVNKTFSLPNDYAPKDLVRPNVPFSFGNQNIEKSYLRKEAALALEKMFQAAKKEGIQLFAVSGYRSYERQNQVFQAEVKAKGRDQAVLAVAVPGQSEHQTGLAIDISAASVNYQLTEKFKNTKEGKWLANNAHKYGFILRYPKGKEKLTGYQYEPWHFRYVGVKYAEIIYKNNWTLEEFFNEAKEI